jgi:hypothetical protein
LRHILSPFMDCPTQSYAVGYAVGYAVIYEMLK